MRCANRFIDVGSAALGNTSGSQLKAWAKYVEF
jgi:hypothetical protein